MCSNKESVFFKGLSLFELATCGGFGVPPIRCLLFHIPPQLFSRAVVAAKLFDNIPGLGFPPLQHHYNTTTTMAKPYKKRHLQALWPVYKQRAHL
jgi:hypothetical protein